MGLIKKEAPLGYVDIVDKHHIDNTGVSDVSTALYNALSLYDNKKLFIRSGKYLLASTLVIDNDCSLMIDADAEFYTNTDDLEVLLKYETSRTVSSTSDLSQRKFISGGTFNGNNKAKVCLQIEKVLNFTLENAMFKNPKETGLLVNNNHTIFAELLATNLYFANDSSNASYQNTAIHTKGGDCIFEDIIMLDFWRGVLDANSGNLFSRIHPWISLAEKYPGSIGFEKTVGSSRYEGCGADTQQYGYVSNGGEFILSNCGATQNPSIWNSELQASYPAYVFKETVKTGYTNIAVNMRVNAQNTPLNILEDVSSTSWRFINSRFVGSPQNAPIDSMSRMHVDTLSATKHSIFDSSRAEKGYINSTGNTVQIYNSKSAKNLKLVGDNGFLEYGDKFVALVTRSNETPTNNITPAQHGQIHIELDTSKVYIAKGLNSSDWVLLN